MDILTVILWSSIGSIVSLAGGIALVKIPQLRKTAVQYALPFGAGALLAAALLGLLPEALHGGDAKTIAWWLIGGFLAFFILERFLGWFHHHHHHDEVDGSAKDRRHVSLVIVGDTMHNAIDGIAIGAAFAVDVPTGIALSIAVAAHEIPQEIGDFGILLAKGVKPAKVILINVLSASATIVTAVLTFVFGQELFGSPAPLLAIAAGFFLYIAASDIIPDIHERPRDEANRQAAMLLLGVAVLAMVIALTPHDHSHEGHNHGAHADHKGHDHSSHDKKDEHKHHDHSSHDGHDHEKHSDHAGHDHGHKKETKQDAAHDHSHEGHNH